MSILNATGEEIGNINAFIIPSAVGKSRQYFEFLDCLDRDLSGFAYRCTTDNGQFKPQICMHQGKRRWNPSDATQLAFLDEVLVEEAWRGQGVGTWAVQRLMKKYKSKINMIATHPTLLTRCDPLPRRRYGAPDPTKQELAEYTVREAGVAEFFSKMGFRKLGATEYIGLAKDPNHPSRSLLPSDDPPFEEVPAPKTEQKHLRYALMNDDTQMAKKELQVWNHEESALLANENASPPASAMQSAATMKLLQSTRRGPSLIPQILYILEGEWSRSIPVDTTSMSTLDSTLGAAFLGMLAAAVLYGVTTVQTFMFFHEYRIRNNDGLRLQSMVLFLWILDTVHLGFTCHGLYYYLVTNFGNYKVLIGPTWTILAQVYLTNLSDFIVRAFFARRVSVLCGQRKTLRVILPFTIILLSCLVVAFGCGFASESFVLKTYTRMNEASWMLYASFATAVTADTLVAVSLCSLLIRSRTGFKRTDDVVSFLMAFTINTGLLTSICAIACFVTYAIWPQKFIFMGIYFALSKLYVNSLLASLNARSSLRVFSDAVSGFPTGVSAPISFPMKGLGTSTSSTSKDIGVMSEMNFA
ncbi:hypothetical protein CPB83DRAFT_886020 [Crepidotus variabilis]|uniref:DUF6534 domain-containing protein n=1 Tax=Crepidotus variabilis TaxID=179855 RepID=A0A9P6JLD7_9AGAR|nr:hypothetical protein CPB83DRAFT_886020 [Crepidotus variabilis]